MKYFDRSANMELYTESVSLSKMAGLFKEQGVDRNQVLSFLVEEGYIVDIRTVTEKGLASGVEMFSGLYNGKQAEFPVYDPSVQRLVAENIGYIKEKWPVTESVKKEPSKCKAAAAPTEQVFIPNEDYVRKYLGIYKDFVILDTETTGFEADDEVVEVGVIDSKGRTIFHSRFYPEKEVNIHAQKVNHLSKSGLLGYDKFTDVYWESLKNTIGDRIVIGHSISYDKRMIAQTLEKNGFSLKEEVDALFEGCLDTKEMAKHWMNVKSHSLNNVTSYIGITREELHEAVDDCRLTLEFINRLEDILTVKSGEYDFVKAPGAVIYHTASEEKEDDELENDER